MEIQRGQVSRGWLPSLSEWRPVSAMALLSLTLGGVAYQMDQLTLRQSLLLTPCSTALLYGCWKARHLATDQPTFPPEKFINFFEGKAHLYPNEAEIVASAILLREPSRWSEFAPEGATEAEVRAQCRPESEHYLAGEAFESLLNKRGYCLAYEGGAQLYPASWLADLLDGSAEIPQGLPHESKSAFEDREAGSRLLRQYDESIEQICSHPFSFEVWDEDAKSAFRHYFSLLDQGGPSLFTRALFSAAAVGALLAGGLLVIRRLLLENGAISYGVDTVGAGILFYAPLIRVWRRERVSYQTAVEGALHQVHLCLPKRKILLAPNLSREERIAIHVENIRREERLFLSYLEEAPFDGVDRQLPFRVDPAIYSKWHLQGTLRSSEAALLLNDRPQDWSFKLPEQPISVRLVLNIRKFCGYYSKEKAAALFNYLNKERNIDRIKERLSEPLAWASIQADEVEPLVEAIRSYGKPRYRAYSGSSRAPERLDLRNELSRWEVAIWKRSWAMATTDLEREQLSSDFCGSFLDEMLTQEEVGAILDRHEDPALTEVPTGSIRRGWRFSRGRDLSRESYPLDTLVIATLWMRGMNPLLDSYCKKVSSATQALANELIGSVRL